MQHEAVKHEELEIVTEETNQSLGLYLPRPVAIRERAWCRSTNVFVMNTKGEVLCQQRSLEKERMPGVWVTHMGGHVGRGETYETNALKELEEEAGVAVQPHELLTWRTTKIPSSRLWVREFVTIQDLPVEAFAPQPGEVEQFAWKSLEEIMKHQAETPEAWKAGTHDFHTEYYCMRSVLAAAQAMGIHKIPHDLHVWPVENTK